MNAEQVRNLWQGALIVLAPPLTAFLVTVLGLPGEKVKVTLDFLAVLPLLWVGWVTYKSSTRNQVASVSALPQEAIKAALASVPDEAKTKIASATMSDTDKVLMAKAVPGVATIVVKDSANGALASIAQDEGHADIVTETQNEIDAKKGTKV